MDPRRSPLIEVTALIAAACGAGGASNDAAPPADVLPGGCDLEPALALGRCEVAGTGAPCTGSTGEEQAFVPLADGDEMIMVLGPQGSIMFVFSARTVGIVPGDPADPASPDNPLVEIFLQRQGAEVSRWRGRVAFAASGDSFTAAGMYVVVDGLDEQLDGAQLHAAAMLHDLAGELRCGAVTFVARR